MNYWKQNRTRRPQSKKRTNWNQRKRSTNAQDQKPKKVRRSLQYLLLLKKFDNAIDYKNIKVLKAFLTKYGKIRPRRKTRISVQQQNTIAKAIRRARAVGLLPFTCDVAITL
jgi:small subunit ribosomal protein S18